MVIYSNIPILNIYYMLSYAYNNLKFSEYRDIDKEHFENVEDLYSEILLKGISLLIKEGLTKSYKSKSEELPVLRGKIDINNTIKRNTLVNKKIVMVYDELTDDILINRILKATILKLSKSHKLKKEKRKNLNGIIALLENIRNIELTINLWENLEYNRHNKRYHFLLEICRFIYEKYLINEKHCKNIGREIEDDQKLSTLFEKFIYSFYKCETGYSVSRPQINWKEDNSNLEALPIMQTDIVLKKGNKVLIIDTKFYSENMIKRFQNGNIKHNSNNIYQMFSYINNWDSSSEEVGGMILYAKTTTQEQPNHNYKIRGKEIQIKHIGLNQDFIQIKKDLIALVDRYFNK